MRIVGIVLSRRNYRAGNQQCLLCKRTNVDCIHANGALNKLSPKNVSDIFCGTPGQDERARPHSACPRSNQQSVNDRQTSKHGANHANNRNSFKKYQRRSHSRCMPFPHYGVQAKRPDGIANLHLSRTASWYAATNHDHQVERW